METVPGVTRLSDDVREHLPAQQMRAELEVHELMNALSRRQHRGPPAPPPQASGGNSGSAGLGRMAPVLQGREVGE